MKYTNRNYLVNLSSLPKFRKKTLKLGSKQKDQANNHSRDSLTNSKDKDSEI